MSPGIRYLLLRISTHGGGRSSSSSFNLRISSELFLKVHSMLWPANSKLFNTHSSSLTLPTFQRNRQLSMNIRSFSSHDNLVEIKPKSSSSKSIPIANPLGNATKSIQQNVSSVNQSIKQRYNRFKRRVRLFILAFLFTFGCVYCLIDHSIRTIIYEFLKEQNLSSYISSITISPADTNTSEKKNVPESK